MPDRSIEIRVA